MAINDIYINPGTVKSFISTGGDALFTPGGILTATGWISTQLDLGASARPGDYLVTAWTRVNANATVGNTVRVYLIFGDGTRTTAVTAGLVDAAVASEDLLRGALPIGAIEVTEASTTVDFVLKRDVYISDRYLQVAFWNVTGQTLHITETVHGVTLTPIVKHLQTT